MAPSVSVLLLTYSAELVDGAPLYVASNNAPVPLLGKEPAGHLFHDAALRKAGYGQESEPVNAALPEKKEKVESPSVDSYHFKGKKKQNADDDQQDHYALLGLSHLRYLATEEQIRKSYRDIALKYHPDKQAAVLMQEATEEAREQKKEEIDQHFKAIQKAYETLLEPTKRRLFDSTDEFDDEVPETCSAGEFFKVFGPVLLRNSRWSVNQPVPSLGDDSTAIAEVDAFYDFWWTFKSWREFPHADEFDLEQAESREHKRWMERQNGKLREKAKKDENVRIRNLTENAYRRDPRILRRKEEEKAEKLRKKEAKILAKQEKELEAQRVVEEERLRKVEEERKLAEAAADQKKIREKEKRQLRKERQRLRAAAASVPALKGVRIADDAIEHLCTTLGMVDMSALCEKLENSKDSEEKVEILKSALKGSEYDLSSVNVSAVESDSKVLGAEAETKAAPKPPVKGAANGYNGSSEKGKKAGAASNGVEKREKPWTKEEVDLLRKAIVKYPKGTSSRWEVVSDYIGTGRSVDEIVRGVKVELLKKPDSSKAFDSFLTKRKPAAEIVSPLSTRDDVDVTASPNSTLDPVANGGAAATSSDEKSKAGPHSNGVYNANGPSVDSELPVANGKANPVDGEGWSEGQEIALVKALKTFPKDTPQRWERIAVSVPGKTKAECFKKFAELRENLRSKKGTN